MDTTKTVFTMEEAADYMRVSSRSIRQWISDGELKCYRIGDGRNIRIDIEHIREYLKNHEVVKDANEYQGIEEEA